MEKKFSIQSKAALHGGGVAAFTLEKDFAEKKNFVEIFFFLIEK